MLYDYLVSMMLFGLVALKLVSMSMSILSESWEKRREPMGCNGVFSQDLGVFMASTGSAFLDEDLLTFDAVVFFLDYDNCRSKSVSMLNSYELLSMKSFGAMMRLSI